MENTEFVVQESSGRAEWEALLVKAPLTLLQNCTKRFAALLSCQWQRRLKVNDIPIVLGVWKSAERIA